MAQQLQHPVADQVDGGLVAREQQLEHRGDQLGAGDEFVVLRVDESGEQVLARAAAPLVDLLGKVRDEFHASLADQARVPAAHQPAPAAQRSEEHTSELQSQSNLVCRLLLEKK